MREKHARTAQTDTADVTYVYDAPVTEAGGAKVDFVLIRQVKQMPDGQTW